MPKKDKPLYEKIAANTANLFMVGKGVGGGIAIMNEVALRMRITDDDAINLAAYLVVLSGKSREEFLELLTAIENT